jgi:hypothetical protein
VLHNIGDTTTRAALFNRFASEIDRDKASTYDLCSAYGFSTKYNDDKICLFGASGNDTKDTDDVDDDDTNDDAAIVAAIDDDGMHDDIAILGSRDPDFPIGVALEVDSSVARDADSLGVAVGVDPSSTTNTSTVSMPLSLCLSVTRILLM